MRRPQFITLAFELRYGIEHLLFQLLVLASDSLVV